VGLFKYYDQIMFAMEVQIHRISEQKKNYLATKP
jgi:hypothetical protein